MRYNYNFEFIDIESDIISIDITINNFKECNISIFHKDQEVEE